MQGICGEACRRQRPRAPFAGKRKAPGNTGGFVRHPTWGLRLA
jgi:hypothetical protein